MDLKSEYWQNVNKFHDRYKFTTFRAALTQINESPNGCLELDDDFSVAISRTLFGFVLVRKSTLEELGPPFCPVSRCGKLAGAGNCCDHVRKDEGLTKQTTAADEGVSSGMEFFPVPELPDCRAEFLRAIACSSVSYSFDLDTQAGTNKAMEFMNDRPFGMVRTENTVFSVRRIKKQHTKQKEYVYSKAMTVTTSEGSYRICQAIGCFRKAIEQEQFRWFCPEHARSDFSYSGYSNMYAGRYELRSGLANLLFSFYGQDGTLETELSMWVNIIRALYLRGMNPSNTVELTKDLRFYRVARQKRMLCISPFCLRQASNAELFSGEYLPCSIGDHNRCNDHNSQDAIENWLYKALANLTYGELSACSDWIEKYKKDYFMTNEQVLEMLNDVNDA